MIQSESIHLQKDALWDLFTKREEYNTSLLDRYQRFPYYLSKHRCVLYPKVSKFLIDNGFKVEYPDNKPFAVCLTHDIDTIFFLKKEIILHMAKYLMRHQIKNVIKTPFYNIIKKWNPVWVFKYIMALEEKYGAKSSFYFQSLKKNDVDFNYRIDDLKCELSNIIDNGWEVGLHGSREAYINLNMIKEEKENLENVLGKKIIGYRNHLLRFKVPDTWELLSKAGLKYDTTFGYADMVGFRNGMCHPFKPINLNTNKEINILEIPITIMDCTLFENYLKLDIKEAWEYTKLLIKTVKKFNGIITILWHNTYMSGVMFQFYEKILNYCKKLNALMTTGENIFDLWYKCEYEDKNSDMNSIIRSLLSINHLNTNS